MRGSKILIVEDEQAHAAELKRFLELAGHIVVGPAPDCSSALELLWGERPDFAFVNTHLGSETCQAVLEECDLQDVPVIIASDDVLNLPPFCRDRTSIQKPVNATTVDFAISRLSA